ncbi:MAG: hypothetical protein NDF54_06555 [archaeon GB-1867-035]|nr:hypothetical protein [Candidatus Culexmicrobium profundum]
MKVVFESRDYIITLTDTKLEIDLKRGARAYVENILEGSRFYKTLRWVLSYIFPRDFYLDEILDISWTPEGDVIIREKTPFGVKDTKITGLTPSQAELLAKTVKSLLEKSKVKLVAGKEA